MREAWAFLQGAATGLLVAIVAAPVLLWVAALTVWSCRILGIHLH